MKFNRSGRVLRATAILFFLTLMSCSSDEGELNFEDFVVSFEHVKSDTGINSVGAEELIWLDESRFLSFSVVIDISGQRQTGLHLISNTGDTKSIADGVISDFCVLGNNILIQGHQGFPVIVGTVPDYNVELVSKNQLLKIEEKEYSALRCGLVSLPEKQPAIFRPLKPEDGFLEITVEDERAWNSLNSAGQSSLFSSAQMTKQDFFTKKIWELYRQSQSKPIWDLYLYEPASKARRKLSGRWPAPPNLSYKEFSKSYFGYQDNRGILSFWDLDVENERVKYDEFQYPEDFVRSGSRVIEPTKAGYILEYHSQKRGGLFLIAYGELTLLKKGTFRNVSVAPDGCHIAYGEGDILRYKKDKLDYRQTVKIADICGYKDALNKYGSAFIKR